MQFVALIRFCVNLGDEYLKHFKDDGPLQHQEYTEICTDYGQQDF